MYVSADHHRRGVGRASTTRSSPARAQGFHEACAGITCPTRRASRCTSRSVPAGRRLPGASASSSALVGRRLVAEDAPPARAGRTAGRAERAALGQPRLVEHTREPRSARSATNRARAPRPGPARRPRAEPAAHSPLVSAAAGSVSVNVDPCTCTEPPWACAIAPTIDRPSPGSRPPGGLRASPEPLEQLVASVGIGTGSLVGHRQSHDRPDAVLRPRPRGRPRAGAQRRPSPSRPPDRARARSRPGSSAPASAPPRRRRRSPVPAAPRPRARRPPRSDPAPAHRP